MWFLDPVKLFGIWWSAKYDRTTWGHFAIGVIFGLVAFVLKKIDVPTDFVYGMALGWNTAYETARGVIGDEAVPKYSQGFNLIDYGAFIIGEIIICLIGELI